jgi:pyruvoyl-dependent arginine decarboxylase (PvlArgDC)
VPEKRPEKSSAAAGRMIAGALGVKAPKKTEEGKAYERAVRENERVSREKLKEEGRTEEREREEARKKVWDG